MFVFSVLVGSCNSNCRNRTRLWPEITARTDGRRPTSMHGGCPVYWSSDCLLLAGTVYASPAAVAPSLTLCVVAFCFQSKLVNNCNSLGNKYSDSSYNCRLTIYQ